MAVLAVVGTKGGCGKSTLASNLLVALKMKGFDVVGIDSDPQRTLSLWAKLRKKEPEIEVQEQLQPILHETLKPEKLHVIDVGARDSQLLRSAILASAIFEGLILIPLIPSAPDLWALEDTLEIIQKAYSQGIRPRPRIVINQSSRTILMREIEEPLREICQEYGAEVLKTKIGQRIAYRRALAEGLSVLELKDPKAKKEVLELTKELLEELKK